MGTLSGLLSLSQSALDADQTALDTTSHNVANQTTAGYTREVTRFTATDTVTINGHATGGTAVTATVSSVRDRVLERLLAYQTQQTAATDTRATALNAVQQGFGLSSTSTNASSTLVGSAIDGFFTSLTNLSANPTDSATRTSVLNAAQTLASAFNTTAQSLDTQVSQLNQQIAAAAPEINTLTSAIATLNQQIGALAPGGDPGTLEDQRTNAVQQLAKIIGVSQTTTENNGITLSTSDGTVLVSGGTSIAVGVTQDANGTELTGGRPPHALTTVTGGSVGGTLQVRDQDIPALQQQLDQLAYSLGSAVNAQNQTGVTPSGAAGQSIFSLPSLSASSAATISVALASPDGIATAGQGEGASGATNAGALAALATANVDNGQTAANAFAQLIGQVGDAAQSATTTNSTAQSALTQVQTQRNALSGVSLNDEAAALTEYQRSYEAAAKVLTVIDQILADALNIGTTAAVA